MSSRHRRNNKKLLEPLKAIVLDNDEASGYYLLIFHIWDTLQQTSLGSQLSVQQVMDFFIEDQGQEMEDTIEYHMFRPGLFTFLQQCVNLRESGAIDSIIMYTHQNSDHTWKKWSIPSFLAALMRAILFYKLGVAIEGRLFDHVLTLPPEGYQREVVGSFGWITKKFDRILTLYPWKPKDIRNILFIDDHATPKFIEADSIDPDKKDISSWYKVSPYRCSYGIRIYISYIQKLIERYNLNVTESDQIIIDKIAKQIIKDKDGAVTYSPNDRTFLDLTSYVVERFATTASKDSRKNNNKER